MLDFGLNQVTMSELPFGDFLDAAASLGCVGVEARNDLGRPVFDGIPPSDIYKTLQSQGLRLLGVSQVYPFNHWKDGIAQDVHDLISLAVDANAETISLIPCNDGSRTDQATQNADLTYALAACLPSLEAANMTALIEPLGFARSSLRLKSDAIAAIETVGGQAHFRLVHDTFHHTLAGETAYYPAQTGIVHISGVNDPTVAVDAMEDTHRELVDANDQLENLAQITALQDAGYRGVYSFECFAQDVRSLPNAANAIKNSIDFISLHTQRRAA